ncbi:hypothetical protein DPMN_050059 [Dreissena polymorpha]|uniref:Uncharacterized protein n=1 Tax=Dreissena polymorpha TaxID=45954 RepID=A0A9D4CGF4_DREPO|nr:hypothetical protein DPMN_050059 [Dreissena polymorpha]
MMSCTHHRLVRAIRLRPSRQRPFVTRQQDTWRRHMSVTSPSRTSDVPSIAMVMQ